MKNKTLLTLCAAPLLLSVNAMAEKVDCWAFSYETSNKALTINDSYTGEDTFNECDDLDLSNVSSVTYNRQFTANVPATIVLPIDDLTENNIPSSNAKFYTLQYVIPDFREAGKRTWLAKMKKIDVHQLQAHKPYAVIVPNTGTITVNFEEYAKLRPKHMANYLEYNATPNEDFHGDTDVNIDYYTEYLNAGDWYFIGNYSNGFYRSGDREVGLCYGFEGSNDSDVPKGSFGKIANGTVKKAFRGLLCKDGDYVHLPASYIKQNGAAKSANMFSIPETINVEFVDTDANGVEHTTYVGKLNRIDNVRLNRERSTFDLKGRNVDGKRTAKGVYLKK